MARRSYRRRAIDEDPIHEEFRKAWNNYSTMIRKTKDEHWMEWLENLDEEGVWTNEQDGVRTSHRQRTKQNTYITSQRSDNQKSNQRSVHQC